MPSRYGKTGWEATIWSHRRVLKTQTYVRSARPQVRRFSLRPCETLAPPRSSSGAGAPGAAPLWLVRGKHEIIGVEITVSSEEKIDWAKCTLVEVKPAVQSGAPVLRGTRMPVGAIVDNFDYGLSVAELAEQFEIPPEHVEAIVAYAKSYRVAHPA
jgi:uncharacterized protein (DUF433 family)